MSLKIPVRIEPSEEAFDLPISAKTRVGDAILQIAERIGEPANNVRVTACGMELAPDLRVCALPPATVLVAEIKALRPPPDANPITPRLIPSAKMSKTMRISVSAEDCQPRVVYVHPAKSINSLRELIHLPADETFDMLIDGRAVVDERKTFSDLMLRDGSKIHFQHSNGEDGTSSSHLSTFGRDRSPRNRASLLLGVLSEDDPTRRREFLHHVKILFEDPDDRGFTYDLTVAAERSIGSLLQFIVNSDSYDLLVDGKRVDASVTFLDATDGYDGSFISCERKRLLDAPPTSSRSTTATTSRATSQATSARGPL